VSVLLDIGYKLRSCCCFYNATSIRNIECNSGEGEGERRRKKGGKTA
jgi:hypothetical protein